MASVTKPIYKQNNEFDILQYQVMETERVIDFSTFANYNIISLWKSCLWSIPYLKHKSIEMQYKEPILTKSATICNFTILLEIEIPDFLENYTCGAFHIWSTNPLSCSARNHSIFLGGIHHFIFARTYVGFTCLTACITRAIALKGKLFTD